MGDSWNEYVDLISTASLDRHPTNTGSAFTNHLVVPQNMPDHSYVGLVEFAYTNSFYNVIAKESSITLFDFVFEHTAGSKENPGTESRYGKMFLAQLEDGYYSSAAKLCSMINRVIKNCGSEQMKDKEIFSYNEITRKFSYDVTGLWISMFLRGTLLHNLGIERSQATFHQYVVLGKSKTGPSYEYPSKGGVERLFLNPKSTWNAVPGEKDKMSYVCQLSMVDTMVIYCDIITSQVTGDVYSQALRMTPIKGKPGSQVVSSYQSVHYMKLNCRYIPSIRVEIRDLYDRPISFHQGIVRLKLHFRENAAN